MVLMILGARMSAKGQNRTCAINASGSRTRHHAFAHGRSRAAIRPTAWAVVPQRTPINSIARNRRVAIGVASCLVVRYVRATDRDLAGSYRVRTGRVWLLSAVVEILDPFLR